MSFFMEKPVCFIIEFHSTYVVLNRNAEIYSKRSCLKHMYVHCRPYDVFIENPYIHTNRIIQLKFV